MQCTPWHFPDHHAASNTEIPAAVAAAKETRRIKQWAPKTRTGCLTCRGRRIKCDEGRPCRKCLNARRVCRYDNSTDKQALGTGESVWSLRPRYGDSESLYYLEVYTSLSMPLLSTYSEDGLFNGVLPRSSWHHPALRHALVAVGMASEQYYAKSSLLRAHRRGWHYNEALRLLYSDKYVDNELVLAACILFWIHDNIMGDARAALVHLRGLLQMVGESKARKMAKGQRAPYLEIAIVHGLSYWGHSVDKALVDKPDPEVIAKIRDRLQDPDYSAKLYSFRTVRDEISLFSTATQWTCSDSGHESCATHEHSVTLEELEAFVHKWYSCVLRGECPLTNDDRISVECHYKTTLFIIKSQRKISAGTTRARLTEPEDRALFEDILQKIESISTNSLSQTPAGRDLVMPLCPIVAEIGRYASDDELMSRSLAAMRNMKRLEGFWNTAVVAALLEILWQQERFSEERLTAEKVTFAVDVLKETQS